MHRLLLIAALLAAGAGAFLVGRGARPEAPPAPVARAEPIEPAGVDAGRWELGTARAPRLAPPDPTPTAAPVTPVDGESTSESTTTTTDPGGSTSTTTQPAPTSAPPAPTAAPPAPTQAPSEPEITGGTGGDP